MGDAAAACQALGMRFSIYNTMRELSNRCVETFAMRALGEAYVPGSGGSGSDWLKEHVGGGFLPAWSTPIPGLGNGYVEDAAMRVVALSRWNNFYVEGIQQMMRDFNLVRVTPRAPRPRRPRAPTPTSARPTAPAGWHLP